MDQAVQEQIKQKLNERQKSLTAQLEGMTKEKTFNKDKVQAKWQDIGDKDEDNAVEVADWQDNISLERNLEINLEKIEKALQKMEDGKYGACETCQQPIEENRLLVYPEAQHCLKCHNK